jgi:hypothetical protein
MYSQCPNKRQNLFCYRYEQKKYHHERLSPVFKKPQFGRVSNFLTEAQKSNEPRPAHPNKPAPVHCATVTLRLQSVL